MEMQGEARIPAPKSVVWDALNDPEALKEAIAGCEELTVEGENAFAAKVRAKVGPVSARFSGKVELLDIDPPNGYRIQGEGTGGAAGFAKGGATVSLEEDGPDATVLKYDVNANVGGKLAQIGARLIDGAAKKMADDFFAKFSEIAASRAGGGAEPPAPEAAAPSPEAAPPAPEPPVAAPSVEAPAVEEAPPAAPSVAAPSAAPSAVSTTGVEASLAEDAAAEASREPPPPPTGKGVPALMWIAGAALVVAAVVYALF